MRNAIFRGNGWALRGLTRLDHRNRFESGGRPWARVRSLAANQCRSNRIVSTTAMEFHDAFHDLKCESYLSFFFFLFSFYFFFSFVRLFVYLSLVFFSFFIDENFHFAFREECLDLFLMPVALYINWILRSRIKRKRGYVRGIFRFCEIKNKKATRVVVF